ncbi:MAG: AMP-binding protein [Pseudomonadota bacterium]
MADIIRHATERGQSTALCSGGHVVSYSELVNEIRYAGWHLSNCPAQAVALDLDNSPVWAVLDLAALNTAIPVVPLPSFFSPQQLLHAIRDAGADCIFTDRADYYRDLLREAGVEISIAVEYTIFGHGFVELRLAGIAPATLPQGTAKITYTSGTTGQPKGVCLSAGAMYRVTRSLCDAGGGRQSDVHLSVLPLATLLENIGGIYVPLLAGATAALPPLAAVGLEGATRFDARRMLKAILQYRATTTIHTPQLLQAMVAACEDAQLVPKTLRFIAVGGAPVSARLLARAAALKLPVFEGYGLSECASVVALNTACARRPGSVGKTLPHVQLAFADDGEILVAGATLLGYTGSDAVVADTFWPTGDVGYLDADGYLHITGRKKNIFITSFGRNVAPEWVERELTLNHAIAQAAVFGEGRPWNVAVIVPHHGLNGHLHEAINSAIADANQILPDYARIKTWIHADAPFTPQNGQLTANGRLRREAIWPVYQQRIEKLYQEINDGVL